MDVVDDERTKLSDSAVKLTPPRGRQLGESAEEQTLEAQFVSTGVSTSSVEEVNVTCTSQKAVGVPASVAHTSSPRCADAAKMLQELDDESKVQIPVSAKGSKDDAHSAAWWVEHDERETLAEENKQLRKITGARVQQELGESAATAARATAAMSGFHSALDQLQKNVQTHLKRRKTLMS